MSLCDGPQLAISYSPKLDLRIKCVRAERYRDLDWVEHRFEVKCTVRHPSGTFEYYVSNLCFDIDSFARFAEGLYGLQQGTSNVATLTSVGEMLALRLERISGQLQAHLTIREYLAPDMATLTATLEVDYDLFVNKLLGEVERFVDELRNIEPDDKG